MQRMIGMHRPRDWSRRFSRLLVVAGMLWLYAFGMIATPMTSYADGTPGGNVGDPAVRAVDIAKAAVVRIITQINGHLIVHFSATQNVTFPQAGSPNNAYSVAALGSGTFISAHGDILTADHVVRPPKDQELANVLITAATPDVTAYYNQTIKPGSQTTPGQMAQLLTSGQIPSDTTYDPPTSRVYLSTDYTGPLNATTLAGVPSSVFAPVDRIEQESAVDQRDVAIIHANMNDMPMVQLDDSSTVQQQDNLTIIGFPGAGDVSTNPTDLLTSSVNKIFVSAIKTTDTGAQVIQVGGTVEQGDSGGPALDSQGHVVGIVSFGTPGGTSFLQASNSARQLIQAQNLDTTPGAFQKAWTQAFNDYSSTAAGHWHKATQEFQSIANIYPAFKAITPYKDFAQTQVQHEKVSTSPSTNNAPSLASSVSLPLIVGVAILLLVVLLLFGVVVTRGRRRRAAQAQPVVVSQHNYGPPPGAPAQQPGNMGQSGASQSGYQQSPTPVPQIGQNSYGTPPQPQPQRIPAPSAQNNWASFGNMPAQSAQQPSPSPAIPPRAPGMGDSTLIAGNGAANSGILRPWPCGHMNRSNARYCSICGEPSPPPPTIRRFEQ